MMWSVLTAALPVLFSILGLILDKVKASNDVKAKFQALVTSAKDDGLISVEAHDEFERQRQELLDDASKPAQP